MLNELVAWVLNTYLGKYLDNFNPTQLSVALLAGEVELENLPIRKDALFNFGIPVEISSGSIGKIKLQVPLRQFRTSPWCLAIDNVQCKLVPKKYDYCDCCGGHQEQEYKYAALNADDTKYFSELKQSESYYTSSYSGWLNFGATLVTKIIENLELRISNVFIKYEDCEISNTSKLSLGIVMKSLVVQSCEPTTPEKSDNNDGFNNFKRIDLTEFSLFECSNYDFMQNIQENYEQIHNLPPDLFYIVKPLCAKGHCYREKSKNDYKCIPKLFIDITLTNLDFTLCDLHYENLKDAVRRLRVLKMIPYFHTKRPSCSVEENPRLWWQYFAFCCGFEIRSENEKLRILKENVKFLKLYRQILTHPNENLSKENESFKVYFESSRSLYELQQLRRACFDLVNTKNVTTKSKRVTTNKSMLFHWFPNWIGWYASSEPALNMSQENDIENEILNAIGTLDTENASWKSSDMISLKIILQSVNLAIGNGSSALNFRQRFEFQIEDIVTFIEFKSHLYKFGCSFGSINLIDKSIQNKFLTYLIQPERNKDFAKILRENSENDINHESTSNLFNMVFENKHSDFHNESSLVLSFGCVEIVYNEKAFTWISNFWSKPDHTPKNKNDKPSVLAGKWRHTGRKLLDCLKVFSLDLQISMPKIIFLSSVDCENPEAVLIDLGDMKFEKSPSIRNEVKSLLKIDHNLYTFDDKESVEEEEEDLYMTPWSTPPGSKASFCISPEYQSTTNIKTYMKEEFEKAFYDKIYDKYLVILANLRVLVGNYDNLSLEKSNGKRQKTFLNISSIAFEIGRRLITTTDQGYPFLTFQCKVPEFSIRLSEKNAKIMNKTIILRKTTSQQTSISEPSSKHVLCNRNEIEIDFELFKIEVILESESKQCLKLEANTLSISIKPSLEATGVNWKLKEICVYNASQSNAQKISCSNPLPYVVNLMGLQLGTDNLVEKFSSDAIEKAITNQPKDKQLDLLLKMESGDADMKAIFGIKKEVDLLIKVIKEMLQTNDKKENDSGKVALVLHLDIKNLNCFMVAPFSHAAIINLQDTYITLNLAPKTSCHGSVRSFSVYENMKNVENLFLFSGLDKSDTYSYTIGDPGTKFSIEENGSGLSIKLNVGSLAYYHHFDFWKKILSNNHEKNKRRRTTHKIYGEAIQNDEPPSSFFSLLENLSLDITFSETYILIPYHQDGTSVLQIYCDKICIISSEISKTPSINYIESYKNFDSVVQSLNITSINLHSKGDLTSLFQKDFATLKQTDDILDNTSFQLSIKCKHRQSPKGIKFVPTFEVHGSFGDLINISFSKKLLQKIVEGLNNSSVPNETSNLGKVKSNPKNYDLEVKFNLNGICFNLLNCDKESIVTIGLNDVDVSLIQYRSINYVQILLKSIKINDDLLPKIHNFELDVNLVAEKRNLNCLNNLSSSCPALSLRETDHNDKTESLSFLQRRKTDVPKHSDNSDIVFDSLTFGKDEKLFKNFSFKFNVSKLKFSLTTLLTLIDFFNVFGGKEKHISAERSTSSTKYNIRFKHFNLIFRRENTDIAQIVANALNVLFIQYNSGFELSVLLRSISIRDLTNYGKAYLEKISISGQKFLHLLFKTEQKNLLDVEKFQTHTTFYIKGASILYVHTKRFFYEINKLIRAILHQTNEDSAEIKHQKIHSSSIDLNLCISFNSSVIMIPVSDVSSYSLIFQMGKLNIYNNYLEFFDNCKCIIKKYFIDLKSVNSYIAKKLVKSLNLLHDSKESTVLGSYVLEPLPGQILNDACGIKIHISQEISEESHPHPFKIHIFLSDVILKLNSQNMKTIQWLSKLNFGENIEEQSEPEENNKIDNYQGIYLKMKLTLSKVCCYFEYRESNFFFVQISEAFAKINYLTDSTKEMFFHSKEFLVGNNANKVLVNHDPKKEEMQVEFYCLLGTDITDYSIKIANNRVIVCLEFFNDVNNFLNEGTNIETIFASEHKTIYRSYQGERNSSSRVDFTAKEFEVVFLENNKNSKGNALHMKFSGQMLWNGHESGSLCGVDISALEVSTCLLGNEIASKIVIIDKFAISSTITEKDVFIELKDQVLVKLSYTDIKLILKIISNLSIPLKLRKDKNVYSDFETVAPLVAMGFTQQDSWDAMVKNNFAMNDAAIWLKNNKIKLYQDPSSGLKTFEIKSNCIMFYIIDDCVDVSFPLMKFCIKNLSLFQQFSTGKSDLTFLEGNAELQLSVEYYNRCLSGWEPLIEPWANKLIWKQTYLMIEKIYKLHLCFQTEQLLKLNVTAAFCLLMKNVHSRWIDDYNKFRKNISEELHLSQKPPFQPFVIKNLLGETLRFKLYLTEPGGMSRTHLSKKFELSSWVSIAHTEKTAFEFDLQSKINQSHSLKFYCHQVCIEIDGWSMVGPLSIEKVATFFRYVTSNKGHTSKIIIDISLIGSAQKLITVRTPYAVVNKLESSIFLKLQKDKKSDNKTIILLNSGLSYNLPLTLIESEIFVKPLSNQEELAWYKEYISKSNLHETVSVDTLERQLTSSGYGLTTKAISWPQSDENIQESLLSKNDKSQSFYMSVDIKKHHIQNKENYHLEGFYIRIKSPLKIINLLCCDVSFIINNSIRGSISPSKASHVHMLDLQEPFFLEISIENYCISGQLRVSPSPFGIFESKLKLTDDLNRALFIRVCVQTLAANTYQIFITAPIWIVNKSNLPLVFRQEGTNQTLSGQFDDHERGCNRCPLMASFSDSEGTPSMEVRLGNSFGKTCTWSKSFGLQKDVICRELKSDENKTCYIIGIKVCRGRGYFGFTHFVTVSQRYQICNNTSFTLKFAQKCDIPSMDSSDKVVIAKPKASFAFHWPNSDQERLLCMKLSNKEYCHWSHGIPLNDMQSFFLNIRNDFGEMIFFRLETILKGSVCLVLISEANNLPAPYRIDNYSDILIHFSQVGCKPNWRSIVRPRSSLSYVLDDPLGLQQLSIEVPGGNSIEINIKNIKTCTEITYENFVYIIFKNSCDPVLLHNKGQLVMAVKDKRIIVTKKKDGERSQLWLITSEGQIEHVGSSPPNDVHQNSKNRLVLDIDGTPRALGTSKLTLRPKNKQRASTQTWRFENGRLMCLSNMCIQILGGINGLKEGNEVVLGMIHNNNKTNCAGESNLGYQFIDIANFRAGSGCLEISCEMDGPVNTIKIKDLNDCEQIYLSPDPTCITNNIFFNKNRDKNKMWECLLNVNFFKGIGISIVGQYPSEELLYMSFDKVVVELLTSHQVAMIDFQFFDFQIDNQLLDTPFPIVLKMLNDSSIPLETKMINLKIKSAVGESWNSFILEDISLELQPCYIFLDEVLMLKLANFFKPRKGLEHGSNTKNNYECIYIEDTTSKISTTRYYIGNVYISPIQIRLSAYTASKLSRDLLYTRNRIGLTLIKFEDAIIDLEKFVDKNNFQTLELCMNAMKSHYINQVKWHAGSILGCVDFLGSPLGFASDLSEGVSSLIFEGSIKSLVKNVTHGISNSTAKLTESISDSLVKVILDEQDNAIRQKMLERQSESSLSHLSAGFKGFGFGLLGGITSIARHAYMGAQVDGLGGFINGVGKGLIGTVTKPIIGVLDLASETASALRESSRSSARNRTNRRRLPRCTNGLPGGLLPLYSYRQSKGQHYLYLINNRNFEEKFIFYEPNIYGYEETKLRMLISSEFVRIFSFHEMSPTITFECHLSEILSCHPISTSSKSKGTVYFIEISTNLPKITRPRIRCQTEEVSERSARYINYAKNIFEEKNQLCI